MSIARENSQILVQPGWFGASDRPLFGWLHEPAAGARGAVVLCPPIGLELQQSQYCFGLLADALAAKGFVVVRFDYDGTGDSAGSSSEPAAVARWVASIEQAVELARSTGVDWVAGVGLRIGATLLANARPRQDLDALILWDPCVSGRSFLREQRTLQSVATRASGEESPGVEIPGWSLSADTASELTTLSIQPATELSSPILLVTDPSRPHRQATEVLAANPRVERQHYAESAPVLDSGAAGYVAPRRTLEQLAAWISERCPSTETQTHRPSGFHDRAVVGSTLAAPVIEETVRLGPLGLFGISTGIGSTSSLPVILFLTNAANSRIGPMRQWVELARLWAGMGFHAVRFDFSGIADSPTRRGQPDHAIYASEVLDDVVDVAHHVSPEDPANVILVGLCSGAVAAMAVAPRLRPRAVVAINPRLTTLGFVPAPEAREREIARLAQSSRAAPPTSRNRKTQWRQHVGDLLPPLLWNVATGIGFGHSPARFLEPLTRAGVPTLLICGPEEAHAARTRTPQLLRRLGEIPLGRFELVPDLEHALNRESDRQVVRKLATSYLEAFVASRLYTAPPSLSGSSSSRRSKSILGLS